MPSVLGRDVKTRFADRLAGRLYAAVLTRKIPGTYDPDDPAHGPTPTPIDYSCDAIAFAYKEEQIDGEHVKNTDFRVTIILGSIRLSNDDAVAAHLNLSAHTASPIDTVVSARATGIAGNLITVELVGDASDGAGTLDEVGTHVELHYKPSVTTFLELEALINASAIVYVLTASSTPAGLVLSGDAFVSVPLAGGTDATSSAVDYVPQPGDVIAIAPPGSDTPVNTIVQGIASLTNVAVTCHVGGALNDG